MHSQGLIDFADKYGVTCTQLMLKWGIQNGFRVIHRSADYEHIEENMKMGFKIEPQDMQKLCELDCGYSTRPKYLTKTEKQRGSVLRTEYKKKRAHNK